MRGGDLYVPGAGRAGWTAECRAAAGLDRAGLREWEFEWIEGVQGWSGFWGNAVIGGWVAVENVGCASVWA